MGSSRWSQAAGLFLPVLPGTVPGLARRANGVNGLPTLTKTGLPAPRGRVLAVCASPAVQLVQATQPTSRDYREDPIKQYS